MVWKSENVGQMSCSAGLCNCSHGFDGWSEHRVTKSSLNCTIVWNTHKLWQITQYDRGGLLLLLMEPWAIVCKKNIPMDPMVLARALFSSGNQRAASFVGANIM